MADGGWRMADGDDDYDIGYIAKGSSTRTIEGKG